MKAKLFVLGLLLTVGCAPLQPTTPRTYEGAAVGAVVGGVAGALLDHRNPWRGGVIGAALGAVAGGTLTELSARAAQEAAQSNRSVEYRTEDGRGVYRAEPQGYDAGTRCHRIHERVWEDNRLVRDRVKEVCEGTTPQRVYAAPPPPPPVIVEERTVPWAPGHGHRAKYRYYYYPGSYVYFDPGRGLYFYLRGGDWHSSRSLPRGIHIEKREYVVLDMDSDRPHHFHAHVEKKYPPGHGKKY